MVQTDADFAMADLEGREWVELFEESWKFRAGEW